MASLDAVPDDAVRAILSHLRVEDLWELRGCARTLRRLAEQAPQWLPIIAPPVRTLVRLASMPFNL